MINEALCKFICHNICCLIQSAHELGVTATFWGKKERAIENKTDECDLVDAMAWI